MTRSSDARIYEVEKLLAHFKKHPGDYFLDFLKVRHLEAGIIKLQPGQRDSQSAHDQDELYFVVSGSGKLKLGDNDSQVRSGTVIFVPKGMDHHFYDNHEELIILYMFAEE